MTRDRYYVETYRPAFPSKVRLAVRAHAARGYNVDLLSPCITAVFEVSACQTKAQAIAAVCEYAAGFSVAVHCIVGLGSKRTEAQ